MVDNNIICHSKNKELLVEMENTKEAWKATIDLNKFVFSSTDFVLKADEILCEL